MATDKKVRHYRSIPISHMLKFTKLSAATPIEKLNKEIILMYEKIRLTDQELDSRTRIFQKYKRLIEEHIDCTVEAFGSSRTMMMVHSSDIDVTVLINTGSNRATARYDDDRQFSNNTLSKIRSLINKAGCISGHVTHIRKAKTPILKLTDKEFGYKIDISINKVDGIQKAEYIKEEIKKQPFLSYFVILLKYFLKRRNLSDAASGGLCSYAQFLMVLDFVNMHPLIQNRNIDVGENIGVLFLDFFQYFGIDFPFERSVISVLDMAYKPNREGGVCIEDPISEGNNVAASCSCIRHIKEIFVYSYKVMTGALSNKVDCKKGVVDLWLRIDMREMKERKKILESVKE